jgi:ABC-type multidrug transport system ATPase subunit
VTEPPAIKTQALTKRFAECISLQNCDLTVETGQVFGLLGPNGAGKSTLIRLLVGMLTPTSGCASVFGADIVRDTLRVKQLTAYLPGDARLYKSMKGRQVAELFAGLRGQPNASKATRIAKSLDLDLSRRVGLMSTGMKQKLALAVTLGSEAPLIILDEPTANLDPEVRRETLRLVMQTRDAGSTVLLSSHLFSDIDGTCDEVAVLRAGQIIARDQLNHDTANRIIEFTLLRPDALNAIGRALGNAETSSSDELEENGQPCSQPNSPREVNLTPTLRGVCRTSERGAELVTLYSNEENYALLESLCQLGSQGAVSDVTVRAVGVEAIYDAAIRAHGSDSPEPASTLAEQGVAK